MTTKKTLANEPDHKENAEEKILKEEEPQQKDAAQQEQAWWDAAMFLNPAQDSDR